MRQVRPSHLRMRHLHLSQLRLILMISSHQTPLFAILRNFQRLFVDKCANTMFVSDNYACFVV
jgi:hypothetical protein